MSGNENDALVSRILASPEFSSAPERIRLFRFLLGNRHRKLSSFEIEHEHFKVPIEIAKVNSGRSRVACKNLRKALRKFTQNSPDESWSCEFPIGDHNREGYQLLFKQVDRLEIATKLIWKPHLDSVSTVIVVVGSHLFFFDPNANKAFRFYDFNDDGKPLQALARLKDEMPEAYDPALTPLHDFFLASGEIYAFEAVQKCFFEHTGVLVPRATSRNVSDQTILTSSPVLIGRPSTNRFIQQIMDSPEAAHLGFRVHSTVGGVRILSPRDHELEDLSRFGITKEGLLPPVPGWTTVFGIVTRLQISGWSGPVTMISAGFYAKAMHKIIETLTTEKLALALLSTIKSLDGGVPESFEMLFAVKVSPGGVEGEGQAELIAYRAY